MMNWPFSFEELYSFFYGLLPLFRRPTATLAVSEKAAGELVSETDRRIEREVLIFLGRHFPGLYIVSEESNPAWPPPSGTFGLVDPLDGTHNYLLGWPFFGSMFAIFQDWRPVLSAIFLPYRAYDAGGGLLVATAGQGAYEIFGNREPVRLQVTKTAELSQAIVLLEAPQRVRQAPIFRKVEETAKRTRTGGLACCIAISSVACGGVVPRGVDAALVFFCKPWDVFPGALLVAEAGGRVTDPQGNPLKVDTLEVSAIFSNGLLHEQLITLVENTK